MRGGGQWAEDGVTLENVGHNKGETTKGLIRSEKTHEVADKTEEAGISEMEVKSLEGGCNYLFESRRRLVVEG